MAVEGTFVCFTKGHDHFISNSIRCSFLRQDQCNVACLESCMRWQLAVITLRGGNELRLLIYAMRVCRFPPLFSIMFLDTLCSKKWYNMPHIERWYSFASVPQFPALVDIRLVTINRHARCFLSIIIIANVFRL